MNYKQLLLKYINHVGLSEGITFLSEHHRGDGDNSVVFTDEEWAALQELDKVKLEKEFINHSCSCHVKNEGPCLICRALGCEVFDFNHIAVMPLSEMDPEFPTIGVEHEALQAGRRPKEGVCPSCGAPETVWCYDGCELIDPMDYR